MQQAPEGRLSRFAETEAAGVEPAAFLFAVVFVVGEQLVGRLGQQLRALARAAFEKQQALAEDKAVEQEGLCIGLLSGQAGGAIELSDILQPRGIDACGGRGGGFVGTRPLPDREFDRHRLGVHALRIQRDDRLQPFAGARTVECSLLLDGGDAAVAPARQHGVQQCSAISKAAVEAALGDAEILRQHLDPYAVDAAMREFGEARRDPDIALVLSHVISGDLP